MDFENILRMEEVVRKTTNSLSKHVVQMQENNQLKALRQLFKKKHRAKIALKANELKFGSFFEPEGGFSARLFLRNRQQLFSNDSSRYTEHFDGQTGWQKIIDLDIASCPTIPSNQERNIIDIPESFGYVTVKGSLTIVNKIWKYWKKSGRSPQKITTELAKRHKLVTKDHKFLNSTTFLERSQKKLDDNNNNYSDLIKEILHEDLNVDYTVKKRNSLLEINLVLEWNSYDLMLLNINKVRLLRTLWWPHCAREWKTRARAWPKQQIVDQISKYALLKPTRVDYQFKYRFSHIERLLAGLRSPEQNMNYFLLKILFYRFIKPLSPQRGSALNSFQIKSIMLFTSERYPPGHPLWAAIYRKNDSMIRYMLEELMKALQQGFLPDYFLIHVNLLKSTSKKTRREVVGVLKRILEKANILLLLPAHEHAESVVTVLVRFKDVIKAMESFFVQTLNDGVLTTITNNPQLLLKVGKNLAGKKLKKSSILLKLFYVAVITATFPLSYFVFIYLRKFLNR